MLVCDIGQECAPNRSKPTRNNSRSASSLSKRAHEQDVAHGVGQDELRERRLAMLSAPYRESGSVAPAVLAPGRHGR